MRRIIRSAVALLFTAIALISQVRAEDSIPLAASSRLFEDLPFFAPWYGTSNPASISTFTMETVNLARAGYSMKNEDFRIYNQPAESSSFYAETQGYLEMGKLSFFGAFGYQNNRYQDVIYNSTLMFNSLNPYIIGDTVPDTQLKEGFELSGKASLRMNNRLSVAIGADYNAAVGAKQKDPRNKNNIASLRITPGIIYDIGKFKLGLNGSVYTSSNEILFSVEGNWKRDLFILQGLGYYKVEPDLTSYSELYSGKGYSGGLQASYEAGNISNTAEVQYLYLKEEVRSGSSYRIIDGVATTNSLVFSDMLRIESGSVYHLFSLNGAFSGLSGDEVLQRMYTVRKPTYSYDSLATISWIENKHLLSDVTIKAGYRHIAMSQADEVKSQIGGNLIFGYYSSGHYPLQTYGEMNIMSMTATAFIEKMFISGSMRITPAAEVLYRKNLSADLSFKEQAQSIPEMVYSDYNVMGADLVGISFKLRFERYLKAKTLRSVYFLPEADMSFASGEESETLTNSFFNLALGLTF